LHVFANFSSFPLPCFFESFPVPPLWGLYHPIVLGFSFFSGSYGTATPPYQQSERPLRRFPTMTSSFSMRLVSHPFPHGLPAISRTQAPRQIYRPLWLFLMYHFFSPSLLKYNRWAGSVFPWFDDTFEIRNFVTSPASPVPPCFVRLNFLCVSPPLFQLEMIDFFFFKSHRISSRVVSSHGFAYPDDRWKCIL